MFTGPDARDGSPQGRLEHMPGAMIDTTQASFSLRERFCLAVCRWLNLRPLPKKAQTVWQRMFGSWFVHSGIRNLLHVEGLERMLELDPPRGVLLCANHRSLFDLYIVSTLLVRHETPWAQRLFYPVRSTFFYETLSGLAINLLIGGGSMFPPIFRDKSKSELNRQSVELVIDLLRSPGSMVGMHPEGTRGTGEDPYELGRAQPGVGRVALRSDALVIPVWINGPLNSVPAQRRANRRRPPNPEHRAIVVFGDPVDLDDLRQEEQRPVVDLRASKRILEHIARLGQRDRELRHEYVRESVPSHPDA